MDAIKLAISEIEQTITKKGQDEREGASAGTAANGVVTARVTEAMDPQIENIIRNLVHASKCENTNCSFPTCKDMKKIYHHVQICKKKVGPNKDCQVCWRVMVFSYHHSYFCQEDECPAYFCIKMKNYIQKRKEKIEKIKKMKRLAKQQAKKMVSNNV